MNPLKPGLALQRGSAFAYTDCVSDTGLSPGPQVAMLGLYEGNSGLATAPEYIRTCPGQAECVRACWADAHVATLAGNPPVGAKFTAPPGG